MIKSTLLEHRWQLLITSVFSIGAAGLNLLLLDFLHGIFDGSSPRALSDWLPQYCLSVAALFLLSFGANFLLVLVASGTVARLRSTLVRRIVNACYTDLERAGRGRLLGSLTDDVDNMSEGMAVAPQFLFNLVTIVLCLTYLATLSMKAFVPFFGILAGGAMLTAVIVVRGNHHYSRYRTFKDQYYREVHTMFDGAKELAIDAKRRRHFLEREILPAIDSLREAELSRELYWNVGEVWARSFLFIALGIAVAATQWASTGGVTLTMTYFAVITFIAGPIEAGLQASSTLSKALHSNRVVAALGIKECPPSLPMPIPADWDEIVFEDVTYTWCADGREVPFHFGPVSLSIRRGEVLFITGGNGSGKSTFAKLLLGLYPRTGGVIRVANVLVGTEPDDDYRSLFAAVFADYHLFSSVLDGEGHPAEDCVLHELLDRVGLAGVIAYRSGVLGSTAVSQGQRKRLALVQAWLQETEVCLLDEWAADQDPAARDHFYRTVLPRMKREGKTLVVITHDDRYFELADRVVTFDEGRVRMARRLEAPP